MGGRGRDGGGVVVCEARERVVDYRWVGCLRRVMRLLPVECKLLVPNYGEDRARVVTGERVGHMGLAYCS